MARKRMIDPDFWTDEALGSLPIHCRLLFMGLISNADDEGRLRGNPALIRSSVFPYDEFTAVEVESFLEQLHSERLIRRYSVDGQAFIDIPNFPKHQTINKPTPSRLPSYIEEPCGTPAPLHEDSGSPTEPLPPKLKEEKLSKEKGNKIAPKSARTRHNDPLFEAIAEVWKGEPYRTDLLTPDQSALVGTAAAKLRKINADPSDVPREWALLRERFDNPSPAALAKHWGTNGTGPRANQPTRASPSSQHDRNMAAVDEFSRRMDELESANATRNV